MAYIYQIINDINGKIYIGKTTRTIEERFIEHCRDSLKRDREQRPLYRAMKKYGIEHFHIELLEETDNPVDRERYWIELKGSFKNGYNATIGGDGKPYIDYDLVVATYKEIKIMRRVASILDISEDSVSRILRLKKVETLDHANAMILSTGKMVNQYDKNGNYIRTHSSARAAAEYLGKITTTSNGASSHISDVCRGKRKTAYGFIWTFVEEEDENEITAKE